MLEFVRTALLEDALAGPRTLAEMHAAHVSRRRREDAPATVEAARKRYALANVEQAVPVVEERVEKPPSAPRRLFGSRIRALFIATVEEFGYSELDLISARRDAPLALARQAAMYAALKTTPWSLPQVGRYFRRDHTTVIHARDKITAMVAADPIFAARVARIAARIPLTPYTGSREAAEA